MKQFTMIATATKAGRLELALESADLLDAARALVAAHAEDRGSCAGPLDFAGRRAWMKASFLAGSSRIRHALLRTCLRAPLPRVREARNACWLEAHGFHVPHPIAAGALGGALPRWQFLVN
ncbi:MAG TPA: hypothetical protein VM509_16255, partial [Planctomycetota bacterium]|nr:hypothetical protein [Planctomycetota bacterium]